MPDTGLPRDDRHARHEEVVADRSRIDPLPTEDLDADTIEFIVAVRKAAGAGEMTEVPEWMRIMARHPALFRLQMLTGTTLFSGTIPPREREMAIVRVAWLCQAPYEFGHHTKLARRNGLSGLEIAAIVGGADTSRWTEHEAAILRGVDELHERKALSDDTWRRLSDTWSDSQLIEYVSLIGQYTAVAYLQNSIRAQLEPDNRGLFSG